MELLRKMAWEVTKGHLTSLLHTYTEGDSPQLDFEACISNFIGEVEDSGILEVTNNQKASPLKTLKNETTKDKNKRV